jgi:hypothetical protein
MKLIYLIYTFCMLLFSCKKQNNQENNEVWTTSYIEIAVISPDHSEKICKILDDNNIISFSSGTNLHALYVNKIDAARALKIIQDSSYWNKSVWDLPIQDTNYKLLPVPEGPGFPK